MPSAPATPADRSQPPESPSGDLRDFQYRQPWHFRLLVRAVTLVGAVVLWCWFRTLRETVLNGEEQKRLREKSAVVFGTFHRGVICTIWFWRWIGGFYLASASKDGEWATGLVRWFGNFTIRGSSSRGGRVAIAEMVAALKSGITGGLIPDAPRGPARVSKIGALIVAQRAGVPLIPVAFAASHGLRAKNWDRTILPRPFSRLIVKFGPAIHVDPALEGEALDRLLVEFDEAMNRLADEVDAAAGLPLEPRP